MSEQNKECIDNTTNQLAKIVLSGAEVYKNAPIFNDKSYKTSKEWKLSTIPCPKKTMSDFCKKIPDIFYKIIRAYSKNQKFSNTNMKELAVEEYIQQCYIDKIVKKIKKCSKSLTSLNFFTKDASLVEYQIREFEDLDDEEKLSQKFIFHDCIYNYINGNKCCSECKTDDVCTLKREYNDNEVEAISKFINGLYIQEKYLDPITNEIMNDPVIVTISREIGFTKGDLHFMRDKNEIGKSIHLNNLILQKKENFMTSTDKKGALKSITVNRTTFNDFFAPGKKGKNKYDIHFETTCKSDEGLVEDLKKLLVYLGFKAENEIIDPVTLCVIDDPVCVKNKPPYYNYDTIFTILKNKAMQNGGNSEYIVDPITRAQIKIGDYKRDAVAKEKIIGFAGKCNKMSVVINFMKK